MSNHKILVKLKNPEKRHLKKLTYSVDEIIRYINFNRGPEWENCDVYNFGMTWYEFEEGKPYEIDKTIIKKGNSIVGFAYFQNNEFNYAFGKPSQSSYVSFIGKDFDDCIAKVIYNT